MFIYILVVESLQIDNPLPVINQIEKGSRLFVAPWDVLRKKEKKKIKIRWKFEEIDLKFCAKHALTFEIVLSA
jgi:hypothetical protein